MIGLDTNILLRFFTRDDDEQSPKAYQIIRQCSESNPGFISSVVLAEFVWTLKRRYGYQQEDIATALDALIYSKEIRLEYPDAMQYALKLYRDSAVDFPDAMIGAIAKLNGCDATLTFDKRAAKLDLFKMV